MGFVYIVRRTDYEDERDEDGSESIVGTYATLQEANDAAEEEVAGNLPVDDYEEEVEGGDGCELEITLRGTWAGHPLLQVCVEEMEVEGAETVSEDGPQTTSINAQKTAPDGLNSETMPGHPSTTSLHSKFGSMSAIPAGKVGGLAGRKFFLLGGFEVLTDHTLRLAVYAYGGAVVMDATEAQYFVCGTGTSASQQDDAMKAGVRMLDEQMFFQLIQEGVPEDAKLDAKAERTEHDIPRAKRARC